MQQQGLADVRLALQNIWGYDDFRSPQGEVVQCLLTGQDSLIILPTGAGKSICFQLPALLQDGLTLVISPLLALMENQVQELTKLGLCASLLHSQLSKSEKRRNLDLIKSNQAKLLYISPETLLSPFLLSVFSDFKLKIQGLIIDEAHCLVQWGDTFRPSYQRLGSVRPYLLQFQPPGSQMAIAAFTATADPISQDIIKRSLGLTNPAIFLANPYRSNLHPEVKMICTPRSRRDQMRNFIGKQGKSCGLVYVRSRRDSENLSLWLQSLGWTNSAYHAGLSAFERRKIELDWLGDRLQFVVCTSAFGMGINKPNVRWVVHFQAPQLLAEYLQEIGRGGRDGKPTKALTLISEPTGWLNPEDRQQSQGLLNKLNRQFQQAEKMAFQLPLKGEVEAVKNEFMNGELTLAMLASMGKLIWLDPFNFQREKNIISDDFKSLILRQKNAVKEMNLFLNTKKCRWQFLLNAFGFSQEAVNFRCGKCDNCQR